MGIAAAIGVGAVGTIASAAIGSSASGRAADAATQAADKSAAVVQRNYDLSAKALEPWQASGLRANTAIDSFLGIPAPAQTTAPATQPNALSQFQGGTGATAQPQTGTNWQQYISSQPDVAYDYSLHSDMTPEQYGPWHYWRDGSKRDLSTYAYAPTPAPAQTATPATAATATNPASGFQQYIQNSDYGFKLSEGGNAVNSGYAGEGTLQSGAAMKALEQYRQNLQQGYRGEYIGALGNQQSLGLTAAQAQAGVGGNAANSLANIYQNQGDAIGNAALLGARNATTAIGGLTSGIFDLYGKKK